MLKPGKTRDGYLKIELFNNGTHAVVTFTVWLLRLSLERFRQG
jgi:hypothetical protein